MTRYSNWQLFGSTPESSAGWAGSVVWCTAASCPLYRFRGLLQALARTGDRTHWLFSTMKGIAGGNLNDLTPHSWWTSVRLRLAPLVDQYAKQLPSCPGLILASPGLQSEPGSQQSFLVGHDFLSLLYYAAYFTWPKLITSTYIQILTPLNITCPSQLGPRVRQKGEKKPQTFLLRWSPLQKLLGYHKPLLRLETSIKVLSRFAPKWATCSSVQARKRKLERQIGVVNKLSRAMFSWDKKLFTSSTGAPFT